MLITSKYISKQNMVNYGSSSSGAFQLMAILDSKMSLISLVLDYRFKELAV